MNTTMTAPLAQSRRPTLTLRSLVVGALAGIGLTYVYIQAALIKGIQMPLPIFVVVSLVLAALVAGRPVGGRRWAPLLGAAWGLLMMFGNPKLAMYHLSHPEDLPTFAAQLVLLALATTGVVAGVAATVQNYRRPEAERRLPAWAERGLLALAAALVGAVLVAAIPQAGGGAQVDAAALAQLPGVPLEAFNGGEIRVRAGELTALRLENPSDVGHSFDVDELGLHVAMPGNADSVALFTAEAPGTYTFYCAPHYDKATGQGMPGTLIVEP